MCYEDSRVSPFHRKAFLWACLLAKITVTKVLQKSKILSLGQACMFWAILLLVEAHLPARSGSELWLKTKPLPRSAKGWRTCWASGHETTQGNVSTFFTPICLKCWSIINSESYQKTTLLRSLWPVTVNLQSISGISARLTLQWTWKGHQVNSLETSRSISVIKKRVLGALHITAAGYWWYTLFRCL